MNLPLRITSAAGDGRYNARIQVPNGTVTVAPSTALNLANLLKDLNPTDDCIFQNEAESGLTGHLIKVDGTAYVWADRSPWVTNDSPPKPVFSGFANC